MSAFWQAFEQGNVAAAECMGEPVVVGGVTTVAVVMPGEHDKSSIKSGMVFDMLVSAVTVVADGMQVMVRGVAGVIYNWEMISEDRYLLHCGPVDRWDGNF